MVSSEELNGDSLMLKHISTDQHFELLPLKPPGEEGRALIRDFEPAGQAAVDAVGREASTGKEKDSFRCAVEWED